MGASPKRVCSTEADEDGDEALNAKEKEEFVEGLRMHVAHEVFGRDDGETCDGGKPPPNAAWRRRHDV